jgi:Protein of unknown function (DUF1045)
MTERFAIYFAPARSTMLDERAETWLAQPDLHGLTVSARRYGFHATIKAPMALADGMDRGGLEMALAKFSARQAPVNMGRLGAHLIDGFLALTPVRQPQELTDFAASVVVAFEPFRAPLEAAERDRRLKAKLTPRQVELVDEYGYPYVLEEFQLHMTLTDRLAVEQRAQLQAKAAAWFADELVAPIVLDRLVLFHEAEPGAAFRRLDDFVLEGAMR